MISLELLDKTAASLKQYRGTGDDEILHDSRDHGNYSDSGWPGIKDMLRRADQTGIAEGLLLNEMIEATLHKSKVNLSRVLREDGFLLKISHILGIQEELMAPLAEPLAAISEYLQQALQAASSDAGTATSREIAVCLRDAIYCMDKGLTMRWLTCDATPMQSHVPLCPVINQYQDTATFADALRENLQPGAHLARIGVDQTAIGIKQFGRIAFLSSFSISTWTGQQEEGMLYNTHMAESLDLDTPVLRYPKWTEKAYADGRQCSWSSRELVTIGANTHTINNISLLSRDRLIWLAMVVDLAAQRMATVDPGAVALCESIARALPGPQANNLPMVIQPNWQAETFTMEGLFESMEFSEWEKKFLLPSLTGLAVDDFLPLGHTPLAIHTITKEISEWPGDGTISYKLANLVKIVPISPNLVGSRQEIEGARKTIIRRNFANWLMEWGNEQFQKMWKENKEWVKKKLAANMAQALKHPCVTLVPADFRVSDGQHFYTQSARHTNYNPRCFFNQKLTVTDAAYINPQSAEHLVAILGLKKETDLPEFLRGWSRDLSWATGADPLGPTDITPPKKNEGPTSIGWCFRRRRPKNGGSRVLEFTVSLNMINVPAELRQRPNPYCGYR